MAAQDRLQDSGNVDYMLVDSIGYQLRLTSSLLRRQFLLRLAEAGLEISPEQVTLLTLLDRDQDGDWSLGQLAAANGHDKAAVTRMTQAMQDAGWIRIVPDPDHGSRKRARITAPGRRLLARVEAVVRLKERDLERHLARSERRQLVAVLHKLRAGIEEAAVA
ncbi:MAG: MarR family transcriptional regulator [Rubrivivax sp.]|nr:MAG: MarR family transcriptional regulator [Rubrivivax sp.]